MKENSEWRKEMEVAIKYMKQKPMELKQTISMSLKGIKSRRRPTDQVTEDG